MAVIHRNRHDERGWFIGPRELGPQPGDIQTQINDLIDAALEREVRLQKPREYLGGSRIGLACMRQVAYEYEKARQDAAAWDAAFAAWQETVGAHGPDDSFEHETPHGFPGKIVRRFRLGHWTEDECAELLRLAGFELETEGPNGYQFGFDTGRDPETGKARMRGHADGIVRKGPVYLPYPLLWENKVMKSSKWNEVSRGGVKKVYPVYFYQMQTYMGYLELHHALFTAYNSDTSELYVEIVPFNAQEAQWATDRAVKVLEARVPEELPRVTNDPSFWQCKFCDFAGRCWSEPSDQTPQQQKPHWLTG